MIAISYCNDDSHDEEKKEWIQCTDPDNMNPPPDYNKWKRKIRRNPTILPSERLEKN